MTSTQRVGVGIIGGGLMGKETAVALARWLTLLDHPIQPVLTAVCDIDEATLRWFDRFETVRTQTTSYPELLAQPDVDVVYAAVRHDLHERIYLDTIQAGKDLLGEKPFGIDLTSAQRIVDACHTNPDVFVRCSSELPFFPGAQVVFGILAQGHIGEVIEASNSFSHSSDLDVTKPISWKRQREFCGEAGVMNDLGMHVAHLPLRLGWKPSSVYAVLQDIVTKRPGPGGVSVACDTYENATLLCTVETEGTRFPMLLATKRIDPGQKNTWMIRAAGMDGGVSFSTRYPKTLKRMRWSGGEQVWESIEMGSQAQFPTVTGSIFETGFSDAVLQMWAAFLAERAGELGSRLGCVTPQEALVSHTVWQAALESTATGRAVTP